MPRMLSDVYWIFWREMRRFARQKSRIAVSIVQPVVWLVLMGSNMAGLTRNPIGAKMLGTSSYLTFMTPGIMVMTALFGGVFGGTSVIWDRRLGILNKMLAAPISRASVPLGKLLAMMVQNWVQVVMILLIAVIMGVRIATGLGGVLFLVLMASLFGMIMGSISLSLAARLKSIETLFAITNFLTMPLMFTSSAIFPIRAMPPWLQAIARVNPLSYAVTPMRTVATQGWLWGQIWPGALMTAALAIVAVLFTIRQFQRGVV